MDLVSSEDVTGKAGTTVQVLGIDPHSLTKALQVHNTLETLPLGAPIIAMYGPRSKPPNFGNAGGGMEPDELQRFQENEPEWFRYYSSLGTLTARDLAVIGCAFRESKDESGFCDLEIMLDPNNKLLLLTDFYYRDSDPQTGVSNIQGHRVVTVWGKYNSYQQRPIKEKDEIDHVEWIDFSMPMTAIFKRLRRELGTSLVYPLYPYWSHVRRSLIGFSKIDDFHKDIHCNPCLVRSMIHPSWGTVFRVGRGDSRFPDSGYLISPNDWYHVFDIMIEKGIEELDNDTILFEFNGKSKMKTLVYDSKGNPKLEERKKDLNLGARIALAKEYQERRMGKDSNIADLAGSEDYTGIPSSAEIIQAEDEEYARWLENELNLEPSQRVTKPRPVA